MDATEELLARDRIRQLAARYALAVDAKDVDGIAKLFVDDVDNGRYGLGHEGVRRFYDQSLRKFHCSMHLIGTHVIDFDDDDTAQGIVYCRAHHHVLQPEHWFDEALAYFDTYERIAGEWRFRRRRVRSWYRQEVGHPVNGPHRVSPTIESSGPKRGARMPEAFSTFDAFWLREPLARPTP
jgi:ketosteroid isomerase-like protein